MASTAAVQEPRLKTFQLGLQELGCTDGKNITLEYRDADGKPERLPELAADLIRLKVDIILAVGDGLVASLSRPGGNITGLSMFAPELSGKRPELIKDILAGVTRVAVLASREFEGYGAQIKEVEAAAQGLGVQLQPTDVRGASDLETAFSTITAKHAGALRTLSDPVTFSLLKRVVELAIKHRIPSNHLQEEYANAGGLVSYGPSYTALFRRAPIYIDKILKGAKPADLPVEQPKKFEFVFNLKAAKRIGLTIPPNVLARADSVIR